MSETYTPPALPDALAAKVTALPFSATLTYKAPTYKAGPDRWTCTLNRENFTYYKGTGCRVFKPAIGGTTKPANPPRSVYDVEAWPRCMVPVDPTAPELLAALISDASCYIDSADLDDFAANYGDIQGDGIQKTSDTYNACARADRLLRRWFTSAELDALREWASQL